MGAPPRDSAMAAAPSPIVAMRPTFTAWLPRSTPRDTADTAALYAAPGSAAQAASRWAARASIVPFTMWAGGSRMSQISPTAWSPRST